MNTLFLDANIIIDFLDDTRLGFLSAQKIMRYCLTNDIGIGTSEDIMTTVFYICRKNIPREKILLFFSSFENFGDFQSFGLLVREKSVEYCQKNSAADFEDTLQAFCAQEHEYDILITNDKNFPSDIISISSSFDFLQTL